MIGGVVTAEREALLPIVLLDSSGLAHDVEAVVDTGFTDYLALPTSMIATLGLAFETAVRASLGDGSEVHLDCFRASVRWGQEDRSVLVLASEAGPLIGMAMLHGHRLTVDIVEGGAGH